MHSRVPYAPTRGSRLRYIGRHERGLSRAARSVWPGLGAGGRGRDRLRVRARRRVPRHPLQRQERRHRCHRDYWKDVPLNQAEVTFRSGELYEAGPWFATEFRCTYRRRRTGDWVDARGAMFCETKDGKVTEMRMYWHRYP